MPLQHIQAYRDCYRRGSTSGNLPGETLARKCYASRHTQNRHGQAGASTMLCCNTLPTYLIIMNSISTNAMFYILFRRQQHINIIFRDIHKMSYTHLKNNKCTHAQAFHQWNSSFLLQETLSMPVTTSADIVVVSGQPKKHEYDFGVQLCGQISLLNWIPYCQYMCVMCVCTICVWPMHVLPCMVVVRVYMDTLMMCSKALSSLITIVRSPYSVLHIMYYIL